MRSAGPQASVSNALLAVMFTIPKEPSAPKDGYCKVNKDTYKDHHRNDSRRHKSPK